MQSFAVSYSVMSDSVNPRAVACQAPLSTGFPRQEHCSGLRFLSPGDLPDSGNEPVSPALAGGFFAVSHQGSLHAKLWEYYSYMTDGPVHAPNARRLFILL